MRRLDPGYDFSALRQRLSAVGRRWNVVEGRIKEVQNIDNAVFIPAINELRYAGRRIVDAWSAYEDESLDPRTRWETIERALTVVEQYVENADHDVTDAICVFLHLKTQNIIERYGFSLANKYLPNITEFLQKLDETNRVIEESRRERNRRNDIYEQIEKEYIPFLKKRIAPFNSQKKRWKSRRLFDRGRREYVLQSISFSSYALSLEH